MLLRYRQENVNYMGYYSSHEQLMQQLILKQANETREEVLTMVQRGMEHCRTHMLWETLLNMSPDKNRKKEVSNTLTSNCDGISFSRIFS